MAKGRRGRRGRGGGSNSNRPRKRRETGKKRAFDSRVHGEAGDRGVRLRRNRIGVGSVIASSALTGQCHRWARRVRGHTHTGHRGTTGQPFGKAPQSVQLESPRGRRGGAKEHRHTCHDAHGTGHCWARLHLVFLRAVQAVHPVRGHGGHEGGCKMVLGR